MTANIFDDPLKKLGKQFPCISDDPNNLDNVIKFRAKCGHPLQKQDTLNYRPKKRFSAYENAAPMKFASKSVLEEKSCAAFALYVVVQSENNWFAAVPESILVPSEPLRALKKVQLQHGSIDILNRTFVNNNNETLECSHLNRLLVGDRIQVFDVVETKIKDDWIATVKEYAVIERTFTYSSAVAVKKRGGEGVHTVYPIDSKLAQILPGAPFSSNLCRYLGVETLPDCFYIGSVHWFVPYTKVFRFPLGTTNEYDDPQFISALTDIITPFTDSEDYAPSTPALKVVSCLKGSMRMFEQMLEDNVQTGILWKSVLTCEIIANNTQRCNDSRYLRFRVEEKEKTSDNLLFLTLSTSAVMPPNHWKTNDSVRMAGAGHKNPVYGRVEQFYNDGTSQKNLLVVGVRDFCGVDATGEGFTSKQGFKAIANVAVGRFIVLDQVTTSLYDPLFAESFENVHLLQETLDTELCRSFRTDWARPDDQQVNENFIHVEAQEHPEAAPDLAPDPTIAEVEYDINASREAFKKRLGFDPKPEQYEFLQCTMACSTEAFRGKTLFVNSAFGSAKTSTTVAATVTCASITPHKVFVLSAKKNHAVVSYCEKLPRDLPAGVKIVVLQSKHFLDGIRAVKTVYDFELLMSEEFRKFFSPLTRTDIKRLAHDAENAKKMAAMWRFVNSQRDIVEKPFRKDLTLVFNNVANPKFVSRVLRAEFYALYKPNIIIGTTQMVLEHFAQFHLSPALLCIDESGVMSAPEFLLLRRRFRHWISDALTILLGDREQLPPYNVISPLTKYLGVTINTLLANSDIPKIEFNWSFRCHPHVTHVLSSVFYQGRLLHGKDKSVDKYQQYGNIGGIHPFMPHQSEGIRFHPHVFRSMETATSFANLDEAEMILGAVNDLISWKGTPKDAKIVILSPYLPQVAYLTRRIDEIRLLKDRVTASTIRAYQGRQTEVSRKSFTFSLTFLCIQIVFISLTCSQFPQKRARSDANEENYKQSIDRALCLSAISRSTEFSMVFCHKVFVSYENIWKEVFDQVNHSAAALQPK
ncbi:hypothetical protein CRE_20977 [Caenorhabditis remanei]|uniref:DNA2/NAM7 helicase-like C-terminal domain-containing protein n=1 Tax=Caenorhabditis remanei TaxID=31234 RepID=E3NFR3_CAERE|nr:hypothetical protein CRE_20977 [Caenorhabditis remanei]